MKSKLRILAVLIVLSLVGASCEGLNGELPTPEQSTLQNGGDGSSGGNSGDDPDGKQ